MVTMKKDMGGAGAVLSLASMIMASKLDVKLRVLILCVENCVAGNAFRPSDVIKSRSGLTVEIETASSSPVRQDGLSRRWKMPSEK